MNEPDIKHWTAKRKTALFMELLRGQTTVAESARQYDLTPSELEKWVDEVKAGMENALRSNPRDVTELYEKKIEELQAAYGEAMLELKARKKLNRHLGLDED